MFRFGLLGKLRRIAGYVAPPPSSTDLHEDDGTTVLYEDDGLTALTED